MPVATAIASVMSMLAGILIFIGGGLSFTDGFMTYLGIQEVLFSFSIILGIATLAFGLLALVGGIIKRLNLLTVSSIGLILMVIGSAGMASAVFVAHSNYLPQDADGPPSPECHQEYESFNDLVRTYRQVGSFFCKAGCPCNYTGSFQDDDLVTNKYGSSKTQECFEFRNLPNLASPAALLADVEQEYQCAGLCGQVFPIYYFSDVNRQRGPVTLSCDGKIRLILDKSAYSIGGCLCAAAVIQLLAWIVIVSNYCHPGFTFIFPNAGRGSMPGPPPPSPRQLKTVVRSTFSLITSPDERDANESKNSSRPETRLLSIATRPQE